MRTNSLLKVASIFIVALCTAFTFQSCDNTKQLTQTELEGYWVLKTLNGEDAKSIFEGAIPTLEFNFKDSLVSGTGGCNRYSGPFTYKKGILSAPNLASTMMLCAEKNAEPQFLLALSNVNNIPSIVDGVLTIKHDGKIVMEFEKGTSQEEKQPVSVNANTLGGNWVLKTIDGAEATSLFADKVPTIAFDFAANKVTGNAGCNNYNAGFALNDAQLIISPLMSTKMACPNLNGESQFTKAISDTSTLSLPNENILQVAKNETVLLVFEKSANQAEAK